MKFDVTTSDWSKDIKFYSHDGFEEISEETPENAEFVCIKDFFLLLLAYNNLLHEDTL